MRLILASGQLQAGGRLVVTNPMTPDDLIEIMDESNPSRLDCDVLVNCSGLDGARDLWGDTTVYPVRGQVHRNHVNPALITYALELSNAWPVGRHHRLTCSRTGALGLRKPTHITQSLELRNARPVGRHHRLPCPMTGALKLRNPSTCYVISNPIPKACCAYIQAPDVMHDQRGVTTVYPARGQMQTNHVT